MVNDPHAADVAFIKALAELLRENDLTELQVKRDYGEDDSLNVRVSRAIPAPPPPPAPQPPMPPHPPAVPQSAPPTQPAADVEDLAAHPGAVTSPMVGTAYLQAEPGSDPFVRIGENVVEGQTLLIVEAMKTMNHIPAPRAGKVRRILIEDGAPVEYGALLMIID